MKLLYPKEVFEQMADASWGIDKETGNEVDKSLSFHQANGGFVQ